MAVDGHRTPGRRMKRLLLPLALAAVPALAATAVAAGDHGAGPAPADGPAGVSIEPLAHATLPERVRAHGAGITIRTRGPRDVLVTSITVAPGGTFGWHTHPGPVLASVASGTLTEYEAHHRGCRTQRFGPGQAFVESAGHEHLARNEGTEPVRIYATFLALTGTTEFLAPAPDPGTCPV